jgi:hypothetical protein
MIPRDDEQLRTNLEGLSVHSADDEEMTEVGENLEHVEQPEVRMEDDLLMLDVFDEAGVYQPSLEAEMLPLTVSAKYRTLSLTSLAALLTNSRYARHLLKFADDSDCSIECRGYVWLLHYLVLNSHDGLKDALNMDNVVRCELPC